MATRWRSVGIVVTPGSGEGRARGVARRLARRLRRRGSAVTIQAFGDLSALTAWAETAEPDFSVLFCVGGDATQSATATLARRHRIPFVPVPTGFGNLFASVFGHSSSARRAARLLADGEIRMVDVGLAGDELFLSHKSYGFIDQVQERGGGGPPPAAGRARRRLSPTTGSRCARCGRTPLAPLVG